MGVGGRGGIRVFMIFGRGFWRRGGGEGDAVMV